MQPMFTKTHATNIYRLWAIKVMRKLVTSWKSLAGVPTVLHTVDRYAYTPHNFLVLFVQHHVINIQAI